MFEYPLINYLPQFILAAVWFCPGLILGVIYGWRAHITFIKAQDGSLQKEGEAQGIKLPAAAEEATLAAPMTDAINKIKASTENHKPGEFFW